MLFQTDCLLVSLFVCQRRRLWVCLCDGKDTSIAFLYCIRFFFIFFDAKSVKFFENSLSFALNPAGVLPFSFVVLPKDVLRTDIHTCVVRDTLQGHHGRSKIQNDLQPIKKNNMMVMMIFLMTSYGPLEILRKPMLWTRQDSNSVCVSS